MLTISLSTAPPATTAEAAAPSQDPTNVFICRSCPYAFPLRGKAWFERKVFPGKAADDVVGGSAAAQNQSTATVQCPNGGCIGMQARYYSVQIRSADEPMTNFYTVRAPSCVRGRGRGANGLCSARRVGMRGGTETRSTTTSARVRIGRGAWDLLLHCDTPSAYRGLQIKRHMQTAEPVQFFLHLCLEEPCLILLRPLANIIGPSWLARQPEAEQTREHPPYPSFSAPRSSPRRSSPSSCTPARAA
ncbi:MAG: hypothetical protein INR71_01475 [Terriglobus roseus]|nr:hypothetical protein [Terriglobus roseus]